MIRFRNSGSDPENQVTILGLLHESFQDGSAFDLEEFANTVAQKHMMSSNGFSGKQALDESRTDDKSKDSMLMDSKLYVEVFRMLGWLVPKEPQQSYPVVISFLGEHIAKSATNWKPLYRECLINMISQTEFTTNVKYSENCRPMVAILQFAIELDGIITSREMCMGPMCLNDNTPNSFTKLCEELRDLRNKTDAERKAAFRKFAKNLDMQENSVVNCTRFPIAALVGAGFLKPISKIIGGKTQHCFEITKAGRDICSTVMSLRDMRLDEFNKYAKKEQDALIRLGFFSMLERAGYDISAKASTVRRDKQTCKHILNGKNILFSPYQILHKDLVNNALGITQEHGVRKVIGNVVCTKKVVPKTIVSLNQDSTVPQHLSDEAKRWVQEIAQRAKGKSAKEITHEIFEEIEDYEQNKFYPLVVALLEILGFTCILSRAGDNGNRWDAMISDPQRSIPIEIKSPRESSTLTLKAIRQALENKIVLLSRKTYKTAQETSSLAVCYKLPNDRADAQRLIEDIFITYNISIGVVGIENLIGSAANIIINNKSFSRETLCNLKGFLHANI